MSIGTLRLVAPGTPRFRIQLIQFAGLAALLTSFGCSRCNRSPPAEKGSNDSPQIPSQLLASAGRLAPILAYNSPECLACAEANCKGKVDNCLNIQGNADAGPAQGRAKSDLCAETLECAIKSRCVAGGSGKNCYCGSAFGLDCISPKANGACKSKLEGSLETTVPSAIAVQYVDEQKGGGAAMQLVQCLINRRCDRCF